MSEHTHFHYEVAAERRRELYLGRLRENAQRFHDRFAALYDELIQKGYGEYIPDELERARGDLAALRGALDSDPEEAVRISKALGASISRLPALARATQREFEEHERERRRKALEEQRQATSALGAFLDEELRSFRDPVVRDYAFAGLRDLRQQLGAQAVDPSRLASMKEEIRRRVAAIRAGAESQAATWKARKEEELRVESQKALLQIHQETVGADVQENPAALGQVLAGLRGLQARLEQGVQLDATAFARELNGLQDRAEEAVLDERCRKETVRGIVEALRAAGFELADVPRREQGDRDEVVIVARKLSGNQAEFRVDLDGGFAYCLDHYQGSACKKDLDSLLPMLQEIYGIRLSDKRVLWENPDRLSASARPLDTHPGRANMATANVPDWLETFERECGIRRAIILHGNVNDLCYHQTCGEDRPAAAVILDVLKKKGFDEVVLWDGFDEVQKGSTTTMDKLRQACLQAQAPPAAPRGQAYDLGGPTQAPVAARAPEVGREPLDATDFFRVVHHHMASDQARRCAFVVDWSHYLFGNANALSEKERHWLLMLGKAVRNDPMPLTTETIGKPPGLLVLLCQKLAGIPPSFYQSHDLVKEVFVPLPGRPEREAFLKRNFVLFRLQPSPSPADPAFSDLVDSLDGSTLRDIQQMARLSRQVKETLTPEKLVNLYRYGEKISPWESLNRAKLATIRDRLWARVKGQDEAIQKVRDVIIRAYTGLSGLHHSRNQRMPKGVLFFVGPTGVGKTELAKALAEFLFGHEDHCLRFDMSEYNQEHSDQRLVGAPPGYVGYEEGGQLTNAVKRRPFSVLLFDEIEKAHPRIMDKFLQILEDGRLTDGKGETVSFAETVIIFTSNIGASEVKMNEDPAAVRAEFQRRVRDRFREELRRPELYGRLSNNIVPFNFIVNTEFLIQVARAKLTPLREFLRDTYKVADFVFANEEKALRSLVASLDSGDGGRGVRNEIQTRIIDPLACFLFEEADDRREFAGRTIKVLQAGSEPNFVFKLE